MPVPSQCGIEHTYVMVVQLGDDAHGCAGGGRERGGDRSGGGQLFGPQCGLDCREGAQTSKIELMEVDATTRARMRASSSGSDCAVDTAERCPVTAAASDTEPQIAAGR